VPNLESAIKCDTNMTPPSLGYVLGLAMTKYVVGLDLLPFRAQTAGLLSETLKMIHASSSPRGLPGV